MGLLRYAHEKKQQPPVMDANCKLLLHAKPFWQCMKLYGSQKSVQVILPELQLAPICSTSLSPFDGQVGLLAPCCTTSPVANGLFSPSLAEASMTNHHNICYRLKEAGRPAQMT